MAAPARSPLVATVEQYVKDAMAANDASHDFNHIDRVRNTAVRLAREEGVEDVELVEIGALLHDVHDWKYSGSETASADAASELLSAHGVDSARIDKVKAIIKGVSFKDELGKPKEAAAAIPIEVAVVQDADRLDAIGAVGIARTFTYGGAKRRPMYDFDSKPTVGMTKEMYMARGGSGNTVNHFYEKLLLLKDMMKTKAGRACAEQRHAFMEQFLTQLYAEIDGTL